MNRINPSSIIRIKNISFLFFIFIAVDCSSQPKDSLAVGKIKPMAEYETTHGDSGVYWFSDSTGRKHPEYFSKEDVFFGGEDMNTGSGVNDFRYDDYVSMGDKYFAAKNDSFTNNYTDAISCYELALKIKPGVHYLEDRICEAYLHVPYFTICPYTSDTAAFIKQKTTYEIAIADSAFAGNNFKKAHDYYCFALYISPGQKYALRQFSICDSALYVEALKNFHPQEADSLFALKDYTGALAAYEEIYITIMGAQMYAIDKKDYANKINYLDEKIALCVRDISIDEFRHYLIDGQCMHDSYKVCYIIAEYAAEKAKTERDYRAAKEFYEYENRNDKAEQMEKLIEQEGK
ncbi:MAG: hypothetical protein HY064_10210 [Bacteroidetes bacterium]|nr:hypothetical protein [Bacteroidota bacterium]